MNDISGKISFFSQTCNSFEKISFIRKLPNGKYRVVSEKGKNLGTYNSESGAKKRLQQVEYFKHNSSDDDNNIIDLTDIESFSLSAIMRKLHKQVSHEILIKFMQKFKSVFDDAIEHQLQDPDRVALQQAIIYLSKLIPIKFNQELLKTAAITELGDNAEQVGKYLSDIVKFTLNRLKPESRPKAIYSLKNKIYNMSAGEIAGKNMPASAAIGQSITFIKHVLFNHDPNYVRKVLDAVVRYL